MALFMSSMSRFQPDISPAMPDSKHWGIGLIGAGGVVFHGHMPAYRKYGFNIIGVASRTRATAERLATHYSIPQIYADWRELVNDPSVHVLDISYPFDEDRLEIVEYAAPRGKHFLIQKPLAHSMENARRLVDIASQHGVTLAVNQNARWCPQYRAAFLAIQKGLIGTPHLLTHTMFNHQDSAPWFQSGWYAKQDRFEIQEYAIHHLDLIRFWTGLEPQRVRASIGRNPNQHCKGDMTASIQLSLPGHALAVLTESNVCTASIEARSDFRIEGTEGAIEGCAMGPLAFTLVSKGSEKPESIELGGSWFPDAFAGTMGELLRSIEEKRVCTISGADNLQTLKLVFDAYADAVS